MATRVSARSTEHQDLLRQGCLPRGSTTSAAPMRPATFARRGGACRAGAPRRGRARPASRASAASPRPRAWRAYATARPARPSRRRAPGPRRCARAPASRTRRRGCRAPPSARSAPEGACRRRPRAGRPGGSGCRVRPGMSTPREGQRPDRAAAWRDGRAHQPPADRPAQARGAPAGGDGVVARASGHAVASTASASWPSSEVTWTMFDVSSRWPREHRRSIRRARRGVPISTASAPPPWRRRAGRGPAAPVARSASRR